MLYRRRIHLPFEKKIEIGSKWIEVMDQSGQPIDLYQAICGRVSSVTQFMVHLEISESRRTDSKPGIVKSDFLARYRKI